MSSVSAGYSREAQVVLLDDARVQTVEVEKQDDRIVEASLWFKNESTSILGLATFRSFLCCHRLIVTIIKNGFLSLFGTEGLFVRAEELPLVELMHQQPLIAFRTCILERSEPEVAGDRSQLFSQRHDLKVVHQQVCHKGALLVVKDCLDDAVARHVKLRQLILVEILEGPLQLASA